MSAGDESALGWVNHSDYRLPASGKAGHGPYPKHLIKAFVAGKPGPGSR